MRKSLFKRIKSIGSKVGPGIVTGASDDDPSGILTYLQSGFLYGFKILWISFLALPFMISIQEMAGRIGYVTDKGLIRIIKDHYSKTLLYFIAIVSVVVITINIGADLLAVGTVAENMVPVSRLFWVPLAALVILFFTVFLSYPRFASVLKWLTLSLFFYIATVFFIKIDWGAVLQATFLPSVVFNKDFIMLVAAFFGTTISPYLFFWQANEEVEDRDENQKDRKLKRFLVTKNELKHLRKDTIFGMVFSEAVTWFIIVSAGGLSLIKGPQLIITFKQASSVLRPLLGPYAFVIFSLGIIGTGLLAIPVLAGSIGYMLAEIFNWREGMNKTWREAKGFYFVIVAATIAGVFMTILNVDPISALIYTAVFYTLITPPIVFIILRIANNKAIMHEKRNGMLANVFGWLTFLFATAITVAYLVSLFL